MGLVDYSDSESDSESPPPPPAQAPRDSEQIVSSKTAAKPFQKLVSRANPGKIVVSLPSSAADGSDTPSQRPDDGPPAKRARTGGGGRFGNFSSFLPPPKATTSKPVAPSASTSTTGTTTAPRPGVHLKTAAEPAFSRDTLTTNGEFGEGETGSGGLNLPPPKDSRASDGPSIQPGQTPAEEVKLVGKPLMFRPLSVARKPAKKKKKTDGPGGTTAAAGTVKKAEDATAEEKSQPPQKKKKISLFSISDPDTASSRPLPSAGEPSTGAYEPLFGQDDSTGDNALTGYEGPASAVHATVSTVSSAGQGQSLDSIADDLNLSAAARRELFGREGQQQQQAGRGGGVGSSKVTNFDMAKEYAHNETVRASGETMVHNPVRAIVPGKHSLRQLVNSAQSNLSALEDSFAAARNNKRDAAGRYGW